MGWFHNYVIDVSRLWASMGELIIADGICRCLAQTRMVRGPAARVSYATAVSPNDNREPHAAGSASCRAAHPGWRTAA